MGLYYWQKDAEWDGTLKMGNEFVFLPAKPKKKPITHWKNFDYRTNHSNIALHRAMLHDGYQAEIDRKIVTFDKDYIQWRIAKLLAPFPVKEQRLIIEQYSAELSKRKNQEMEIQ